MIREEKCRKGTVCNCERSLTRLFDLTASRAGRFELVDAATFPTVVAPTRSDFAEAVNLNCLVCDHHDNRLRSPDVVTFLLQGSG